MRITEQELFAECEAFRGFCPACDNFVRDGVEPDAQGHACPECGGSAVVGAELAVIQGKLDLML